MKERYAMHRAVSWLLLALPAFGQPPFSWKDLGGGRVELSESGKPALVYNYGPQWKQSAPEDRRRGCPCWTISRRITGIIAGYSGRGRWWRWGARSTTSG